MRAPLHALILIPVCMISPLNSSWIKPCMYAAELVETRVCTSEIENAVTVKVAGVLLPKR